VAFLAYRQSPARAKRGCRNNALCLVFKLVERLSGDWRALIGGEIFMTLLLEGWTFEQGLRLPKPVRPVGL